MFIDESTIEVRSGSGGDGCVSFRREKYVPRGGPDGGNGGRGGSVYLRADTSLTTLIDLSRRRIYAAANGRSGGSNNKTGRCGEDIFVSVPVGTVVRQVPENPTAGRADADGPADGAPAGRTTPQSALLEAARSGVLLGDLVEPGQSLLVAEGGNGGRGNKSFASSTHQVPRVNTEGKPGETRRLYLELKLLADVGLVGLPNAGKSTLLSRVSAAQPKVAAYPFTTLEPHLGIVELSGFRRLVIADIPGLIEGAHAGHGLGVEFLRHIERTGVLLHMLSCESGDVEAMVDDYRTIENELASYSATLGEKPRLVVITKVDLLDAESAEEIKQQVEAGLGLASDSVLLLSGVTGQGLQELLEAADRLVAESRAPSDDDSTFDF